MSRLLMAVGVLLLGTNAVFAHTTSVPHAHPHAPGDAMLFDVGYGVVLVLAIAVAFGLLVVKRMRDRS